jgi:hypothetical protein
MQIDAFLADSVVAAEGKLYVQGAGWNAIFTPTVPFRQNRLGVGVLIEVPYTATNQMHNLVLKIVDADENSIPIADAPPGVETPDGKIHELKGQFTVGRPPLLPPGDEQMVPIALNIEGLEFKEPGRYSVVISISGTEMKRLPIRVQQVAQMPTSNVAG